MLAATWKPSLREGFLAFCNCLYMTFLLSVLCCHKQNNAKPARPVLRTVFLLLWFGFVVLFGGGGGGVGRMMMFMSALLLQRPPLAKRLPSEKYHSRYLFVHSSGTVSELTNSKCQPSGWRQSDICPSGNMPTPLPLAGLLKPKWMPAKLGAYDPLC